jgi:protein-S-isoprenylcysteine O-methyltransferase Ste14
MVFRFAIWVIFIIGGAVAGYFLDTIWCPEFLYNWLWHIIAFVVGVLVMRLVMTISRNTGRILARYGREGDLPRMETNRLVTEGPYACMRHPMHLGLFLFPMAFALLSGFLSFIMLIVPLEIFLMLIMIFLIEEPEAKRKFGKQYDDYKKTTPAFNFSVKCLKRLLQKVER